ncbi:hypothetical protein D3C72_2517150 [compost metagenome]
MVISSSLSRPGLVPNRISPSSPWISSRPMIFAFSGCQVSPLSMHCEIESLTILACLNISGSNSCLPFISVPMATI